MSAPNTYTTWECDQCDRKVTMPGTHQGDPDWNDWSRIALTTGYGSTGHWGVGSSVYQDGKAAPYRTRLVCSRECAHDALDRILNHMWGKP